MLAIHASTAFFMPKNSERKPKIMENRTHRLDAWTGLGQTLPEGTTPEEALELAGLAGWNVRRVPLTAQAAPGVTVEVPGNFAVLRDTDGDPAVVSVVGPDYQVIQNEDLLPLAYALIEETGAQVVTAGRLPRGVRESSFLTLRMPRPLKVGQDAVELYMTLQNTHDGRAASAVVLTPVHVQSRAVLNLDLPGVPHKLRLTHYAGAQEMLQKQVQDAMDHVYAYTDAFEEIAGEMATRRLSQAGFQKLTYKEFAAPASAPSATQTRAENKLMRMERLYSARGQENGWAALVAIAEWHDFYSPVRPVGGSEIAARQRKALLAPDVKVKALALLSAD